MVLVAMALALCANGEVSETRNGIFLVAEPRRGPERDFEPMETRRLYAVRDCRHRLDFPSVVEPPEKGVARD